MITITRRLEFDAGHRVLGHEGKCKHLHGHRYVVEITVMASALDSLGRVIDFSVIKTIVGGWIDRHWDHNMLLHPDDPLARLYDIECISGIHKAEIFGDKSPYIMPRYASNPTAENISHVLFNLATDLLSVHAITIVGVRVWETPNSRASYTRD